VLALALMREDEDDRIDGGWIQTLEEALDAHRAETPLRARLLSRLAATLWRRPPLARAPALARESIRLARSGEDADALALVLVRAYRILQTGPGDEATLAETVRELAAAVERTRDPIVALGARLCLVMDAIQTGDRSVLEEQVSRIVQQAEAVGAPHADWCALVARAARNHLLGQLASADELAGQALAVGESVGLRLARQNYVLQLLAIRWDQGRLGELEPILRPAAESPSHPMPWRVAWTMTKLAAGSAGPAREILREFGTDPGRLPVDISYGSSVYMLAEIAVQLEDTDSAEILAPRLKALRRRHATPGLGYCQWGSMERPLGCVYGLLGRWDEAESALEAGLASDRRFGAVAAVARGQRDLGALLARRGRAADRPRARTLFEEARSLAHGIGMAAVVQFCGEWLGRL
jgi:tetratricopeptide (TPR) repeat protein